jgi:hypothetical protein
MAAVSFFATGSVPDPCKIPDMPADKAFSHGSTALDETIEVEMRSFSESR